jgi:cellulose synthase/poly-beta-1,6-N-acetylglucosamine synthase-like glycosyltransferase
VGLNAWSRFETAHTAIQYFSFALAGMPYMGVGRNLAFKLQAYERAGGFSAHLDLLSGDDDLLVNAVATSQNVAICLHPESFMYSDAKKTWLEWARQKRRHLSAGRRYRPLHRAVLTLVSGSQVLHFFLFAVLLLAGIEMVGVVSLFLLRGFSVFFIYRKILPKLCESDLLARVPIFDVLLAVYYGAFVPMWLVMRKNTRVAWK